MSKEVITEDLVSRLHEWNGQESICTCQSLTQEAAECLEAALPFLRAYAKSCEACEGSGEKVVGNAPDDYWSEPCEHCKPTWDLIERIQPPRAPIPLAQSVKEEDDVLF